MMMFLLKLGSRREIDTLAKSPEVLLNLCKLSGKEQDKMPVNKTLDDFLGNLPEDQLPRLIKKMIVRLIRMRIFDKSKIEGYLPIAVDLTGFYSSDKKRGENCLTQEHSNGKITYHNMVLESKIITPEGLALSFRSEFVENANPDASKQDCELEAFKRLAEQIKNNFPRLKICLIFDGLYANGSVLDICEKNSWKYITVFKPGALPKAWKQYREKIKEMPNRYLERKLPDGEYLHLRWARKLSYLDGKKRAHVFNAFECETPEQRASGKGKSHVYITNFNVTRQNVVALSEGGRRRWKIENEGFKNQKRDGFGLEHVFSYSDTQTKQYYYLLQIAHMVHQLLEKGSLLRSALKSLGGRKSLTRNLRDALVYLVMSVSALELSEGGSIQIRLVGW